MAEFPIGSRYRNVRPSFYLQFEPDAVEWTRFSRVDRVIGERYTSYEPSEESTVHTVKEGETLHVLARMYYGDSQKWYVIADHNPLAAFYPLEIPPFTVLEIPPVSEIGQTPSQL